MNCFRAKPRTKPPSLRKRIFLFSVGLLECCIFGGLIFGWPQLVYLLKQEGIYSDLCNNTYTASTGLNSNTSTAPLGGLGGQPHASVDCSSSEPRLHGGCGSNDSHATVRETADPPLAPASAPADSNRRKECTETQSAEEKQETPAHRQVCPAQDDRYALFFTLAVVCYALPSVLVGYILHHAGLWVTRFITSVMLMLSFTCFALVSKERPYLLLPALLLLSSGGNQARLAAVQLGDLFKERRSTAITLLMGSYSVSSSLFYLFQVGVDAGVSRSLLSWVMVAIAGLSFLATFAMPVHHVSELEPAEDGTDQLSPDANVVPPGKIGEPLNTSLLSMSSYLHLYWITVAPFALNNYNQVFNYWVTESSCTLQEVRKYTDIFSFCGIIGAFVAPVLGAVSDLIVHFYKKGHSFSPLDSKLQEVSSHFIPLMITTISVIGLFFFLSFFDEVSIYLSLVCLIVCRSSIFSTSTAFLRSRFPVDHLARLLGIYGTVSALLLFLQYPYFIWFMNSYLTAVIVGTLITSLSLTYPLHLLSKGRMKGALLSTFFDDIGCELQQKDALNV